MKKPSDLNEWLTTAAIALLIAGMIWNVAGIFIPSKQVRDLNNSGDELRRALDEFDENNF
jgi:hypothetical protein